MAVKSFIIQAPGCELVTTFDNVSKAFVSILSAFVSLVVTTFDKLSKTSASF
jgi:hypothetical protein